MENSTFFGTKKIVCKCLSGILLTVLCGISALAAVKDQVLEWNAIANSTILSSGTNPLLTSRIMAMVSGSVFDAVNGVEPRFTSLIVRPGAQNGASARAAAVQAAYAILVYVYPEEGVSLKSQRDASLAALSGDEKHRSIEAGVSWGQKVADRIWARRLGDGLAPPSPPFVGVLGIENSPAAIGVWRPTPPANLPAALPQVASITPWVLRSPSQFRLPAQIALTSAQYAADYNETKLMGAFNGSARSSDQSELALFWNGNTPLYWNRIAAQVAAERSLTLSENAQLLALMNVAMADAAIACWDTKFRYVTWRPVTAIQNGGADGNFATDPDPQWTPWLVNTPAHPEYPSAHSAVSEAAAWILAAILGEDNPFDVSSDVRPGTRHFASFSAATAEIRDARVYGGIHFRTSCILGNALGLNVARYVYTHAMRRDSGDRGDD